MTLGQASARLGGLVKGSLRQIRVLRRGASPRVVRAQVVGTRGRTSVTGPQLRARLGLYDTWARFTVITANVSRGDGNTPAPSAGGSGETGTGSGGAEPRTGGRRASRPSPLYRVRYAGEAGPAVRVTRRRG